MLLTGIVVGAESGKTKGPKGHPPTKEAKDGGNMTYKELMQEANMNLKKAEQQSAELLRVKSAKGEKKGGTV